MYNSLQIVQCEFLNSIVILWSMNSIKATFINNAYEIYSSETWINQSSNQSSVDREEVCIELIYFRAIFYIDSERYGRIMLCCIAIITILYILFDVNYFLRIIFTIIWSRFFAKKKKLLDTITIYGKFSS